MSRILVTGGAGYVGSVCASQLLKAGHEVTIVDDLSTGFRDAVPAGAELRTVDMGDSPRFSEVLRERRPDVVFHFAAKALIGESVKNPTMFFETNVVKSFSMIEDLRAAGITKFVFSSTAATYGNPTQVPIPEDHPKNPCNSYGESKLAFERILQWYATAYGWSAVAFRYFNACGAADSLGERHDPETHLIPLLLQTASGRRSVFQVYGTDYPTPDGSCLRDYVHVLDIADAHLLALQKLHEPGFRVYNIGTGTSYSVLEICRLAEEVTGRKLNIQHGERRAGDPAVLCASPERIMSDFGWKPKHSDLRHIMNTAWQWEQQQAGQLASSSGRRS